MKKIVVLLLAVLPFLVTSCKKAATADFSYELQYNENHTSVLCKTHNYSANADDYEWTLTSTYYGTERSVEFEPSFLIDVAGEYLLSLHAHNSKDDDWVDKTFTIILEDNGGGGTNPTTPTTPTASFNFNSSNGNYAPTTIYCNNTSSNATRYQWTLTKPDYTSSTSSITNPSFNCNLAGTYTLKLIAYNSNDVSSVSEQSFTLVTPSTVTINYLKLIKIPMTDTDNSSWDTGLLSDADPDIYFKLLNASSSSLYTSATKDNVASTMFPVTWSNVNKVLDYGSNYIIKFYDEDGLDPDDLMVSCALNTSVMTPGNSTYTWTAANGKTQFVLGLTWASSKGSSELLTDSENMK